MEAEARYIRAKAYIDHKQPAKAVEDLTILSKDTRTVHGAEHSAFTLYIVFIVFYYCFSLPNLSSIIAAISSSPL